MPLPDDANPWPELPYAAWKDTYETLHLWTQIVGKVRLTLTPWLNHSWHVTFYVTARGLTTSAMPLDGRDLEIEFDFIDHVLWLRTSDGHFRQVVLRPVTVARVLRRRDARALRTRRRRAHRRDAERNSRCGALQRGPHARRLRPRLRQPALPRARRGRTGCSAHFRTGFLGKASPVHFFWGSFDLAATRFSGRRAPLLTSHTPGLPDAVGCEAYSHEESSAGFWPGGGPIDYPAYYSYAYPEPEGFAKAAVRPKQAFYFNDYGQFILPYDAVRTAAIRRPR